MNMPRALLSVLLTQLPLVTRSLADYSTLQIPQQIQYQGRVAQNGTAWTGEGFFVFALIENGTVLWNNWQGTYDPASGTLTDPGSAVLADKFTTVSVSGGSFSVRLGSDPAGNNKPVQPTVFFNPQANSIRSAVKLAVWFSSDSQNFTRLSPDVSLASVPYAMVAGIAETVKERSIGGAQLADDAVSRVKVGDGVIGTSELAGSDGGLAPVAGAVSSEKILDGTIQSRDLSPGLRVSAPLPGTVVSYAGDTVPADSGWLLCDGRELPKASYPELAAVLSTKYGTPVQNPTATHFKLPDYRGLFLRGVDDPDGANGLPAAARDPDAGARKDMATGLSTIGGVVGSVQPHAIQDHRHNPFEGYSFGGARTGAPAKVAGGGFASYEGANRTGLVLNAAVSEETRPINAYVNYLIKY